MMTRASTVFDELRLGSGSGISVLEWFEDGVHISVRLADHDRLGCLMERLEVRPARGARLEIDPAGLEQRLSYLGESLVVIEQAKAEGKAVLRSSPPSVDDMHIYFFEMVADRDEGVSLVRYEYDSIACERKIIPAPLTITTLGRLIDDLKALLGRN